MLWKCVSVSEIRRVPKIKRLHKSFQEFQNAKVRDLKSNPDTKELQLLYSFLVKHCNRKAYQLEFVRCFAEGCKHCSLLPDRDNQFLRVIKDFGGTLLMPVFSEVYKTHYKNLNEMLTVKNNQQHHNPLGFAWKCQ